jgi:nucleoside-diphosphate kinase
MTKMAGKITFTIIKPLAFHKNHTGPILSQIANAGFRLSAIRSLQLTVDQAREFYKIHAERPFYKDLVESMTSGPVVIAIVEKENAVEDFRKLIGSTNPSEAAEGTIRRIYGVSLSANAIHGSDSDENAEREADFFFTKEERF